MNFQKAEKTKLLKTQDLAVNKKFTSDEKNSGIVFCIDSV